MQLDRDGMASRGQASRDGETFTCTVTGTTPITDSFHRVHMHGPELL